MKEIESEEPSPIRQDIMKPSRSTLNQLLNDIVPLKILPTSEPVVKGDLGPTTNPTKPVVAIEQEKNVSESNGPEAPESLISLPPLSNQESNLKPQQAGPEEPKENPGILTVREPLREDVLFGRGGGTNFHQGNMNYRAKIKAKQRDYINARQRAIKTIIISDIIGQVCIEGGRFLKQDDKDKLWYEVDEKEVKKKTSQTLREGAPQWRKANGEWQRREQLTVSQPGVVIAPAGALPVGGAGAPLQINPQIFADDESGTEAVVSPRDAAQSTPDPAIIQAQGPLQAIDASQPPLKKKAKTSAAGVTGLDLLSDVAFLHSVHEKRVQKVKKPLQPPPCQVESESAVALQKWRVEHQSLLNSKR